MTTTKTKQEFDVTMCSRFPELMAERHWPRSKTCMCEGFSCDSGWHDIIQNTFAKLDTLRRKFEMNIRIRQVKEKFGTLRIYFTVSDGEMPPTTEESALLSEVAGLLVDHACCQSSMTCEVCGKHGEMHHKDTLLKTLCKDCAEEKTFEVGSSWGFAKSSPKNKQIS